MHWDVLIRIIVTSVSRRSAVTATWVQKSEHSTCRQHICMAKISSLERLAIVLISLVTANDDQKNKKNRACLRDGCFSNAGFILHPDWIERRVYIFQSSRVACQQRLQWRSQPSQLGVRLLSLPNTNPVSLFGPHFKPPRGRAKMHKSPNIIFLPK